MTTQNGRPGCAAGTSRAFGCRYGAASRVKRAPWSRLGSVRARAKQYRLSWDEANSGSCGLQDGQHGHAAAEELVSAAIGGEQLMGAGARGGETGQLHVMAA